MKWWLRRGMFLLLLVPMLECSAAGEVKPFVAESLNRLMEHHAGRSMLVVFWSSECPPCMQELQMLSHYKKRDRFSLVLVSVDDRMAPARITGLLESVGLGDAESWVFADPFTARLYYAVDPAWQGALPRSEWISASGLRHSHLGRLERAHLNDWLAREP